MANENEPATKGDLNEGLDNLEKRLHAELASKADLSAGLDSLEKRLRAELASKDDLAALEKRLDAKMGALENRLLREIGQALNVAVESLDTRPDRMTAGA